jgi:transposase
VAEVARDLDVSGTVLRRWKKELASEGNQAFPGNGKLTDEQEELCKLREENRQLRMERDILKKATAFFAKESK